MIDLFGNETSGEYTGRHQHTLIKRKLGPLHYRPSTDKSVRCATCTHRFLKAGHAKRYYKCDLVGCTASPASDIRMGHVCDAWSKQTEEAQG
jgi:hypothetical protein